MVKWAARVVFWHLVGRIVPVTNFAVERLRPLGQADDFVDALLRKRLR